MTGGSAIVIDKFAALNQKWETFFLESLQNELHHQQVALPFEIWIPCCFFDNVLMVILTRNFDKIETLIML